ncbi:VRR-NUC domain-containing protein [Lacticaseibacillus absianus]|uniref:VRR-NUC domain-containing protein n=1 Tax=Lacticaseibacillus absianus TaxID=2729623 RepID=UPI003CCD3234
MNKIKSEHAIQSEIMLALSAHGCVVARTNVGTVRTEDGRLFNAGPPKGWPDVTAIRRADGRAVLVECKNARGRLREDQKRFAAMIANTEIIYGVCRSADDALRLLAEHPVEEPEDDEAMREALGFSPWDVE